MGLLALGPFLHAHYGHMQATGFHINGLEAASFAAMNTAPADRPMVSAPTEQESLAVGVVTSLPRFEEGDSFSPDTLEVLLLSFFIVSVFNCLPRAWPWVPTRHLFVASSFQAGFPPPAHAPPDSR